MGNPCGKGVFLFDSDVLRAAFSSSISELSWLPPVVGRWSFFLALLADSLWKLSRSEVEPGLLGSQ